MYIHLDVFLVLLMLGSSNLMTNLLYLSMEKKHQNY
jgi:hypothetical protein